MTGNDDDSPNSLTRRGFLGSLGAAAAAVLARPGHVDAAPPPTALPESGRLRTAQRIRIRACDRQFSRGARRLRSNGEEKDYPYIANFAKGLPHNRLGEVNREAYRFLLKALRTGRISDFDNIPLGDGKKRLKNPQAAFGFDLQGPDSCQLSLPPAPRIDSAHGAAELVELYRLALCRDIHFDDYASSPMVIDAARELSELAGYEGPKVDGAVPPGLTFRGTTPGDLRGPYISQFLYKNVPFGSLVYPQLQQTVLPGFSYLTDYESWYLNIIGGNTGAADQPDPIPRYIRNGRDLAEYVRIDRLYQAPLNAALILLGGGDLGVGYAYPENLGLPYATSPNQQGFGTFGYPHLLTLVAEVTTRVLKAVWFHKWLVHRKLRPEEFGGRVHVKLAHGTSYPIHDDVLNSSALSEVASRFGTFLLPQAYHAGCPTHPAYASGHAVVMGAGVTILKAWFDENQIVRDPVTASADGLSLIPYTGNDAGELTVRGELDKLAHNVSIGRNWAGIHYRSDSIEGIRFGEEVAIRLLREQAGTYNESFTMSFTSFDGRKVVITGDGRG